MPLFMVRKEDFDWIKCGCKHIEVRKGVKISGDKAVFLCSKWMLKGKIVRNEQGKLSDIVNDSNFKDVIPVAKNANEARAYIENLYGTKKGVFTAYYFTLASKKPKVIM